MFFPTPTPTPSILFVCRKFFNDLVKKYTNLCRKMLDLLENFATHQFPTPIFPYPFTFLSQKMLYPYPSSNFIFLPLYYFR